MAIRTNCNKFHSMPLDCFLKLADPALVIENPIPISIVSVGKRCEFILNVLNPILNLS